MPRTSLPTDNDIPGEVYIVRLSCLFITSLLRVLIYDNLYCMYDTQVLAMPNEHFLEVLRHRCERSGDPKTATVERGKGTLWVSGEVHVTRLISMPPYAHLLAVGSESQAKSCFHSTKTTVEYPNIRSTILHSHPSKLAALYKQSHP